MEPTTLILAFIMALGTVFIGSVSGGVGLILRPALIFLGIPAVAVVGTVRFAAVFGDVPTIYLLHKNKKIDWKLVGLLVAPMFVGSLIAGIAVVSILKQSLELVIGFLLLIVGIVLVLKRNAGLVEKESFFSHKNSKIVGFFVTIVLSFLNTIVGGLGPLFSSFYIANFGKSYISASALGKTTSYLGTGLASIVFVIAGVIDWWLFVVLIGAFLFGSYFGTHFTLKRGESWVKYLVILIVFVSAIKMIFF